MSKEIIDQLHQFGLSINEAKVYLTLLGKNSYSATEIANTAKVPRQMTYKILDNLIDKGLCVLRPGKIKKYSAADPQSGLTHLVEKQEMQAQRSRELLKTLKEYFEAGQKEENPLEYITIIKEKKLVTELFKKLENEAENEILVFAKPPFSKTHNNNDVEIEKLTKGIKFKLIFDNSDENKKMIIDENDLLDNYVLSGGEVRIVDELPIKLAVFDEKKVLFNLKDPITHSNSLTSILLEQSDFAKIMKLAFEKVWDSATPWDEFKKANFKLNE